MHKKLQAFKTSQFLFIIVIVSIDWFNKWPDMLQI